MQVKNNIRYKLTLLPSLHKLLTFLLNPGARPQFRSSSRNDTKPRTMRLSRYISLAASIALVRAQGSCRFGNGTLLPDEPAWNIYQPCPNDDGPGTICCALNRSQPPWGNFSLGPTRDDCLPNGLCQNRITTSEGERVTTFVRENDKC